MNKLFSLSKVASFIKSIPHTKKHVRGYFSTVTEKLDAVVTGLHLTRQYRICVWDIIVAF